MGKNMESMYKEWMGVKEELLGKNKSLKLVLPFALLEELYHEYKPRYDDKLGRKDSLINS